MDRGYVKLWRKALDCGLLQNGPAWQLFGYLLLKAAHKGYVATMGRVSCDVLPGESVFGRLRAANDLNLGEQQIRTALKTLEKMKIVTTKSTNKFTVVSFVNWDVYQSDGDKTNQQNNQQTTSKQPAANHIQECKKERKKEEDNTPYIPLEGDGEQEPTSLSLFTLASAEPDVVQGTSPSAETGKGAQRSKRKVKGADLPPYTAWFEECWKAYPRRSGKANAWRAFYELDELGEIPPDMVQRIKNRCFEPDWQRGIKNPEEERYIPHMATWLHARGWEDDGCESVVDHRNTPEDIRRNEIMGLYNFGMPMKGDTLEQAKQRSIEMNLALDAAGL